MPLSCYYSECRNENECRRRAKCADAMKICDINQSNHPDERMNIKLSDIKMPRYSDEIHWVASKH
jgi:hypothetical protein